MSDAELFTETAPESMPIRERNYLQMDAYAKRLAAAAMRREVYPADFSSVRKYEKSIAPLRQLLRDRLGYPPPGLFERGGPARLKRIGEDATATYHRCWIPVGPKLDTYGLYLVPKQVTLPRPLLIAQHGGGGTPETATFIGSNYNDLVRGALAEGYVVFAPLTLFNPFSDAEHNSPLPEGVRVKLDARLKLFGTSIAALEIAKISRALDTLLERPEVLPDRVGMAGLSYGGYYTLYVTALEPRIRCAVSSCYFNKTLNWLAAEQPQAWGDLRYLGWLSDLADPEIVALICPRPLQTQVGYSDELFPVAGARRVSKRARDYYQRLGLEDRFDFTAFKGGHEWHGPSAWPFLRKWL